MKHTARLLALVAVLFLGLAAAPSAAPALPAAQDAKPAFDAEGNLYLGLGGAVDAAVRWLRAQQDDDGSYGGSVTDTAWVLRALADSHRAYTRDDGPFVREALDYLATRQDADGKIYDPETQEPMRIEQSVLALLALEKYTDPTSKAVYAKLAASFQALPNTKETPLSAADAKRLVKERWSERLPDGTWKRKSETAIVSTAGAVIDLSRARRALSKPSSSAPRDVTKLPPFSAADRQQSEDALERGALYLVFLKNEDGRWGPPGETDAGLTAMVLGALQSLPAPRPDSVQQTIDAGLAWLVSLQKDDGSIHDGKLKNYITSAAVLALAKSGREEFQPVIAKARDYIKLLQADEGEGYSEGDRFYGGIGYGGDERPDLSNLQFALEALNAAGVESDDEAFQRALKFLERTQNRSESNDVEIDTGDGVIKSGDDGGAGYAPGDSKAGFAVLPDGTKIPRSYGSMTYSLLKGYLFAGLPKDDPRMQAAWTWVTDNYTLDVNPGFEHASDPDAAYQGLYYYFLSMARALDLYGQEVVTDGEGVEHKWRAELCGRLIAMQSKDDGSWVNRNSPRWWEGNPTLATAYAMLTLEAAMPKGGAR